MQHGYNSIRHSCNILRGRYNFKLVKSWNCSLDFFLTNFIEISREVQNNVQLTFTKYLNRNETLSKFMRTYISFHVKFCCHGHYITLFWVSLRDFQKNLDTGKLFCCVLYIKQQYKFYKLRPYVLIKYPLPM